MLLIYVILYYLNFINIIVRQLNLYGFHKSKGITKCGDSYELDTFHSKATKEEINQIVKPNKKMKNLVEYIKSNQKEESTDNDFVSTGSQDEVLKFLFEKTEENAQNSLILRKEMDELKEENIKLNNEIKELKSLLNSHANLIEKILKKQSESKVQKYTTNIKNLNELFSRYLYFLKIYSPYVNIDNLIKQKTDKEETLSADNINTDQKETKESVINNINIIQSNTNNENEFEEISLFNNNDGFFSLDLNLNNNNSSKSFFNVF